MEFDFTASFEFTIVTGNVGIVFTAWPSMLY